jgi:predicted PurR-regulated permease PerM
MFTNYLKIPRIASTVIVFILAAIIISLAFIVFIPDMAIQIKTLQKLIPTFLETAPPVIQSGVDNFIKSLSNYGGIIPSVTQFFVNLITVLILSFYLVIDKDNLNKRMFALTPRKYHDQIRFIQKIIDQSFASFVRIQLLWGLIGGLITWITLSIFGVNFAASTSLASGILTTVPVIGPIIGVVPPLLVSLIEKPNQALIIFLVIFVSLVLFICLTIIGVKFALILAIFSGFAEIVPIIGPIFATAVAAIVAYMGGTSNFGLDPFRTALVVIAVYFVVRQIQDYLINPYIMGKITKLHPLIILFAVLAGEHTAGILGLLIAVPLAGVIKIIFEYSLDVITDKEIEEKYS